MWNYKSYYAEASVLWEARGPKPSAPLPQNKNPALYILRISTCNTINVITNVWHVQKWYVFKKIIFYDIFDPFFESPLVAVSGRSDPKYSRTDLITTSGDHCTHVHTWTPSRLHTTRNASGPTAADVFRARSRNRNNVLLFFLLSRDGVRRFFF